MREILRSTPFRLTLILGATFVVALVIAGLVAFELIESELAQRMDQSITDAFDVIAQAYGDSDLVDLTDSVNGHARATIDRDRVYALADANGGIIAGNVATLPNGTGWLTIPATALAIAGDDLRYRVFVGSVEGNRLLVGQSFVESTAIAHLVLTSIAWASAVILVLVVATGVFIAARGQQRIDGIAATMARVGHGELAARIHVSARGDDIDMLARQVNAALERLGGLVEGMRQVSVNIAHDLKTPLNRLAITVEAAANAGEKDGRVASLLTQAELEIRQINSTFDALLRIAQIEAGARRARFVPVQVADVLDRIADAYVDVAEEQGQSLTVRHSTDLPLIEGDTDLLTQLCANLVENSIRHAPVGTRISITAFANDNLLVLTFADTGPGIPEDERANVFRRLYRVDKSRTTPGNGLGLSLVKAIADLHGAEIDLDDNLPGLKVSLTFPVKGAPAL